MSARARRPAGDRHGWNSLQGYFSAHESNLVRLSAYIVDDYSDLHIVWVDPTTLRLQGRVSCQHGLFVDVSKVLAVNARGMVRTIRYSYRAGMDGEPPRTIFRYDNAHTYLREGHADEHHKHCFDYMTWEEIRPPIHVGASNWPTLAEVIDELHDWWQEFGHFMHPDIE